MRSLVMLIRAALVGPWRSTRPPRPRPAPANAFRLMSYNLQFNNPDPEATLDAIAAADPDVVVFQEVTPAWRVALVARLGDRYPHRAFRVHRRAAGLGVMSKLPLAAETQLDAVDWFPAQRFTVVTAFGRVQVLNLHLRPAIDRGSWVRGYLSTPPIRRREVEAFWSELAHDVPTIVAGDFNEDPSGSAVGYLARHLTRARPAGPTTWHFMRRGVDVLQMDIDHVMVSRELDARDAHVLAAGASDHRPVVVTIARPG